MQLFARYTKPWAHTNNTTDGVPYKKHFSMLCSEKTIEIDSLYGHFFFWNYKCFNASRHLKMADEDVSICSFAENKDAQLLPHELPSRETFERNQTVKKA